MEWPSLTLSHLPWFGTKQISTLGRTNKQRHTKPSVSFRLGGTISSTYRMRSVYPGSRRLFLLLLREPHGTPEPKTASRLTTALLLDYYNK